MKQIVEEYWSFDGSIQEVISMFLKSNPDYKVGNIQLSYTTQHGVYALVVYEYANWVYKMNGVKEMNAAQEMELRDLLEKYLDHNLITTSVHITIKGNNIFITDGDEK